MTRRLCDPSRGSHQQGICMFEKHPLLRPPMGSQLTPGCPRDPVPLTQGQVTETKRRHGMGPGTCHPLTIMFLVWPLLSGGEFCSSLGTTSNSEEVPCAERELQAARAKKKKKFQPTADSRREGQGMEEKSLLTSSSSRQPLRAELSCPGGYPSAHVRP